ncbi:Ig-like domain-containing protein [Melittangium boletus]|uniref:Ig-like domain-containing protein n=1 Tax=Melittangium boletus TaxID=83453 RepID=UPI003DA464FE
MKSSKFSRWLPVMLSLAGCTEDPPPAETPRLDAVKVTCAPATVNVGQSAQCTASATDQNGAPFSVTGFTWTSSDEAIAQVDTTGKASARALGSTAIRASVTSGDTTRQGEATLSVAARPFTEHSAPLTASETWSAAASPHLVRGALSVGEGATLTLEPGAEVRFASDAELRVRGALLAPGTAQAPIVLAAEGTGAPGAWRGVVFASAGEASRLSHVRVSDCGAASGEGACLTLREQATPLLQDVAVSGSASLGVRVLDDGSAFGPGSARLSVSRSASYALQVSANHADSLPPSSSYADNARDAVEIVGDVSRSLTWPHPGVPFVVNGPLHVAKPRPDAATLTLSAGITVRFGANAELVASPDVLNAWGALVVEGTEAQPVLLTADAEAPKPGHWRGVHLFGLLPPFFSRLSHLTIEYAGAPSDQPQRGRGNLNLYGFSTEDCLTCATVTDATFQKSSGPGLSLEVGSTFGPGSARLTVRDNNGYAMRVAPNSAGSIPRSIILSGNTPNAVEVDCKEAVGVIYYNQTWPNLGLPYVIQQTVDVGYGAEPTLTLEPGTQLRFAANTAVIVGFTGAGKLNARGTAQAPISFIPDFDTGNYGVWHGLYFWDSAGSRLDHVLITHGGVPGDKDYGIAADGNLNVFREQGAFVTNSTFRRAYGCAVAASNGAPKNSTQVTTQFLDPAYGNSAVDNGFNRQCVR